MMLAILPIVLFTACSSDDDNSNNLKLDKSELVLYHDGTHILKVLGNSDRLSFKSENPKVASVDEYGKITGNCIGNTTILISSGNSLLKCKVKVIPMITYIPEPYLGFGETYNTVKNVITKESPNTIISVKEINNSIFLKRKADNAQFVYAYNFENGVLKSSMIFLVTTQYPQSGKSLLEFISERYFPVTKISSTGYGFISPDNKIVVVVVSNDDGVLSVSFTPRT